MNKNYLPHIFAIIFLTTAAPSCKKFVQVPPPKTGLVDASVFSNTASVKGALSRIYAEMSSDANSFASGSTGSVTFLGGLSSDELIDYTFSRDYSAIYQNNIATQNGYPTLSIWNNPYNYIYRCNAIIEGTASSGSIISSDKMSLVAEAKFIRAFCYFYLTNFYGDVPLHLSSNYRQNQSDERTTQDKVYSQIISDLKKPLITCRLRHLPICGFHPTVMLRQHSLPGYTYTPACTLNPLILPRG